MIDQPPPHGVVRKVYNQVAPKYAGLYEGVGPLPHFYQTRLRLVEANLRQKSGGVVLDVGSGPGIVGDRVRAAGFRYVAADSSIGMARECRIRAQGDPGRQAAAARAKALPFASGVFDVVMALGVLEYVEDIETALSECRRVLRPHGTFLVSLLNKSSPYRILKRIRRRLKLDRDPIPAVHFTKREAARLLDAAGFEVEQLDYFDMELLPPAFAERHPGFAERMATAWERLAGTPLGHLATAMLIDAAPRL